MDKSELIPRILIADDDPCVLRAVADRCARMGFDVDTATNGLQVLMKAGDWQPDILVIDVHLPELDGLSALAYLRDTAKKTIHVMAVTGNPGREIMEICERLCVSCIHKGANFWSELETSLVMIYPHRADAIGRAANRLAEIRKRPRILLVDDDVGVKKHFFHRFRDLGADLLYAADGMQGFWMARREEPVVVVTDYYMPNCGAEYFVSRLRNTPETRSIPIIVQTGRRLNDEIKRRLRQKICGRPGATRILQKSFDDGELFDALQRFCGFAGNLDGELLYA